MTTEKKRKFIIGFVYFTILFGLSIVLVRYALPALLPFVLAFFVTLMLKPAVNFCTRRLRINRKASSAFFVILFYGTIGLLVVLLIIKLIGYIGVWLARLPDFFNQTIVPVLKSAGNGVTDLLAGINTDFDLDLDAAATKLISSLSSMISDFSGKALTVVGSYATSVPNVMLNIVITIISTAFMLMDYDDIKAFIVRQLPDEKRIFIGKIFEHLGKVIWKYLTSYLLIMLITFAEIALGLLILGQKNFASIAAAIAVFDILPVVGSGLILIPWAVICMLTGSLGKGIGLVILWAILSVIRQIIEPKIVGDTVGMHPLLTLFGMLFGNFVYGGVGIFLVPIAIALCQTLQRDGLVTLYKEPSAEETAEGSGTAESKLWNKCVTLLGRLFKKQTKKSDGNAEDKNSEDKK